MRFARLVVALLLVTLAGACGDDTAAPSDGGDSDGSGTTVLYETCTTEPADCPTSCPAGQILTCCTCIKPPTRTAGRTPCGEMSEYCDPAPTDPVNIGCLMPDGFPDPPPADPPLVTVRGVVDVYGSGNTTAGGNIMVEFYRMAPDGSLGELINATPLPGATLAACQDSLLPVPFESGDEATCCPGPCRELTDEATSCTPTSDDCRPLWLYEVPGIPTSTPLILHTSGDPAFWKDLYYSNVFFFPEDQEPEGYVFYRAKILSLDDWRSIPTAAGIFAGIGAGRGAVAGEIHDCDNVKLFFATVGVTPAPASDIVYFNGVEKKPYPDRMRDSTHTDALYAALDLPPGPVRVSALAQVEGVGLVNLGWWDARVFPDSLSVVTIRGTRPTQVPLP